MDIGIRADGMTTSDFENFAIEIVKKNLRIVVFMGLRKAKMMVLTALMILFLPLSLSKLNDGR